MHESAKNADTEIIGYRNLYECRYARVRKKCRYRDNRYRHLATSSTPPFFFARVGAPSGFGSSRPSATARAEGSQVSRLSERSQICTLSIPRKTSGRFAPVVRGVRSSVCGPAPALSLILLSGAFAPDINGAGARAPISSITEGAGRGTDERILAASFIREHEATLLKSDDNAISKRCLKAHYSDGR